jgi:hypothetical protein
MDQLQNPYAPPRADISDPRFVGAGGEALRREGDLVVIPVNGARFPDRCVVCNQPVVKRLQRKLYWHAPALYALICVGILIYAIVALIVRKTAHFEIGLCEAHVKRRRNGILIGWLGFFAGLVALIATADRAPELILVFALAMIGAAVAGILMTQVVAAKRIDNVNAWIKVGRPFLDSL